MAFNCYPPAFISSNIITITKIVFLLLFLILLNLNLSTETFEIQKEKKIISRCSGIRKIIIIFIITFIFIIIKFKNRHFTVDPFKSIHLKAIFLD